MASIFTKIVRGELPCHKILEDEKFLAFLEIKPVNPGHTLVIPKKEVDYFFDLDEATLGEIMVFSKKVAWVIQKAFPCRKVGVIVAGLEVPHAHVHLIPILHSLSELSFSRARAAENRELAEAAEKIRQAWKQRV
jgi:histidine triad (HIT) family protein